MEREELLVETLVTLSDTLVDTYDLIEFMQTLAARCVELLDVSEAGIMLGAQDGKLRHVACSSEQMRLVELVELQVEEGPCFDAYTTHAAVTYVSPEDAQARWPLFSPHAREAGFEAVSAVPMRLRSQVIGALNLFSTRSTPLDQHDLAVAQAMADIATIGILQERTIQDSRAFSGQLEVALDSRVAIEQAKGIVAERNHVAVDEAFQQIREFARKNNRLLSETARQISTGALLPVKLIEPRPSPRPS